jgi:hypothetical protein
MYGKTVMLGKTKMGSILLRRRLSIARKLILATLSAGCLVSTAAVSHASASVAQLGSEGSGAGQYKKPGGVAVNQASGDVYVVDQDNQRVDEFDPAGTPLISWGWGTADGEAQALQVCTATCFAGIEGAGAGQFSFPEGIAINDDPLSTSNGDVYVVDQRNNRVEKFTESGDFLLMFGGKVNKTEVETPGSTEVDQNVCTAASGDICQDGEQGSGAGQFDHFFGLPIAVDSAGTVYVGDEKSVQKFSAEGVYESQLPISEVRGLAVNSAGDLYILSYEFAGVHEYSPSGSSIATFDTSGNPSTIGVNISGDLFVSDDGNTHRIIEYNGAGSEAASFDQDEESGSDGIAFGETADVLYVAGSVVRAVTPPTLPAAPIVLPHSESVSGVTPTGAILTASLNPEGRATTYSFEYGLTTSYGNSTPGVLLDASFEDTEISANLGELQPSTTYHYRTVVTSSAGTTYGPDETVETQPPALVEASATEVTATTAVLEAQIDPLGSDTHYYFQYGAVSCATDPSSCISTPTPVPDIGSGKNTQIVMVHLTELRPETNYHYRVVTENELGVTTTRDLTFTTQPIGGSLVLPDDRGYELVSQVEKNGGSVFGIDGVSGGGVVQAAANGDAVTYVLSATAGNAKSAPFVSQYLSSRGPEGWTVEPIDNPTNSQTFAAIGRGAPYKAFSSNLEVGLVPSFDNPGAIGADTENPPLTADAPPGYQNVYLRNNSTGVLNALMTKTNSTRDQTASKFGLEFDIATPDLTHVVVSSSAALTPRATEEEPFGQAGPQNLYEWTDGELQLVNVLPGQIQGTPGANLGETREPSSPRAISEDGSRVVFSEEGNHAGLYMREGIGTPQASTVQLDASHGGPDSGGGLFATASTDGSRIFFTDTMRLTSNSAIEGEQLGDLYEYNADSKKLTDLTVDEGGTLHGSGVVGVLGASDDGAYVYFVANGVLSTGASPGNCVPGVQGYLPSTACNLYVSHNGVITFIAKLSGEDNGREEPQPGFSVGIIPFDWAPTLGERTVRISPDGQQLVFMSTRGLTSYDNHGATCTPNVQTRTFGPGNCSEVYLYEAVENRLNCVSCDPSGAIPTGPSGIPGATDIEPGAGIYQSRVLSANGERLFFDSVDALVPQDTNNKMNVYEYEKQGAGSCKTAGGCVFLISGAKNSESSEFVDASENGDDVFFTTSAQLVPQDDDELVDLYDARVGGGAPAGVTPPVCTGTGCQGLPATPPIFATPSSVTFDGVGNFTPSSLVALKPKTLTRAQDLAKALEACQEQAKKKRRTCERRARKRYGPQTKAKAKTKFNGRKRARGKQ